MAEHELLEALVEIEQVLQIQPPIGAAELPPELRFFRVLGFLREQLCPKVETMIGLSNKPEGEIATVIADCLISSFGQIPLPVATVSKHLAKIGVTRFCTDQNTLLE